MMMEKLDFMIRKWEGQESNRKEKGLASSSTEPTLISEFPPTYDDEGVNTDNQEQHQPLLQKPINCRTIKASRLHMSSAAAKGLAINLIEAIVNSEIPVKPNEAGKHIKKNPSRGVREIRKSKSIGNSSVSCR